MADLLESIYVAYKIVKSRKHTIRKVYFSANSSTDLLLIGHVEFGLGDGHKVAQDFTANFVLVESGGGLLLQRYQAWVVSGTCDSLPHELS